MGEKRQFITVGKILNVFTKEEKHQIIQEMLSTGCTKRDIWEKYTGKAEEHGQILKWMRKLGYATEPSSIKTIFVEKTNQMSRKKIVQTPSEESFENLQLKKRIAELESQLKDAEMKAIAFSTMVDIAEREFKIPIRKKLNTKP